MWTGQQPLGSGVMLTRPPNKPPPCYRTGRVGRESSLDRSTSVVVEPAALEYSLVPLAQTACALETPCATR